MNIFIDLDDVFHLLHRPIIDNEFQVCGVNASKQLVSNVMNLAGHYRNWSIKEKIKPTVYLIYTSNDKKFKNNIYIPNYRDHYFDINSNNTDYFFINKAIHESYDILHVICKYIEGVYLIDSRYLEPCIVPMLLADYHKADWNLLISRDTYNLQYCYLDRWSMISSKGNNSVFLNKSDIWSYIVHRANIKHGEENLLNYEPELYVLLKSITGDKYRSVPRLKRCGWKSLFNMLDDAINNTKYSGNLLEVQLKYIMDILSKKGIKDEDINNNLSCIDIRSQVDILLDTDKFLIFNQILDMEDYAALIKLNNNSFSNYPINLNFLCNKLVI
jgi:hypothetical protein